MPGHAAPPPGHHPAPPPSTWLPGQESTQRPEQQKNNLPEWMTRPTVWRQKFLPWRSRTRAFTGRMWDRIDDNGPSDDAGCFLMTILLLPFLLLRIALFLVALVGSVPWVLETVVQLVLSPFTFLARVLGLMDIEVYVGDREHRELVRGWGASKRRRDELKQAVRQGARPPFPPSGSPGPQW